MATLTIRNIDERTKAIMAKSAQEAESRRFSVRKQQIEREKKKETDKIETEHLRAVDEVQNSIRLAAILLPPLPALLMGLFIFARRRKRESATIPASRQRGTK